MTSTPPDSPDTIAALFDADPMSLNDGQLDDLIMELRRRRNTFTSEEAAKAAKPPKTRAASGTTPPSVSLGKSAADVNLDDL